MKSKSLLLWAPWKSSTKVMPVLYLTSAIILCVCVYYNLYGMNSYIETVPEIKIKKAIFRLKIILTSSLSSTWIFQKFLTSNINIIIPHADWLTDQRERERERERERGRKREGEWKRVRKRERERERERERDVEYGYWIYFIAFNNGSFIN